MRQVLRGAGPAPTAECLRRARAESQIPDNVYLLFVTPEIDPYCREHLQADERYRTDETSVNDAYGRNVTMICFNCKSNKNIHLEKGWNFSNSVRQVRCFL
jgi:hypothetical protein